MKALPLIMLSILLPANLLRRYRCSGMMALDVFASGNDRDSHFWNSLIRQMLLEGLLKKDIEEYGVLKITKDGEAFLKKPKSFKIVLEQSV